MKFSSETVLKTGLIALPLVVVLLAVVYFTQVGTVELNNLANAGNVAGTQVQTAPDVVDLSNQIPIMPDAEILSIDRNNNEVYVVLQTNKSDTDIKNYYTNYFIENSWNNSINGYFEKDGSKIDYTSNNGIIQVKLTKPL